MRLLRRREQRRLVRCLEQQVWFLGQDVLSPAGNLLVWHGFHKWKPPFVPGSSRYRRAWRDRVVELHSFCIGLYGGGRDGFVYVRAHDAAYGYRGQCPPLPGRYRREWLQPLSQPGFGEFVEWLLEYEQWVEDRCGASYREVAYQRYHRKWLAPAAARTWLENWKNES